MPPTDEKYFKQAKELIPERWTTRPELILDKRGGEYVAMAALRLSLAYMVWNPDWASAAGDDGSSIWRKGRWLFSRRVGPLRCVLWCRGQEGEPAEEG